MNDAEREHIINSIVIELRHWDKPGLDRLNKLWRENNGWESANASIYEMATELAKERRLIT